MTLAFGLGFSIRSEWTPTGSGFGGLFAAALEPGGKSPSGVDFGFGARAELVDAVDDRHFVADCSNWFSPEQDAETADGWPRGFRGAFAVRVGRAERVEKSAVVALEGVVGDDYSFVVALEGVVEGGSVVEPSGPKACVEQRAGSGGPEPAARRSWCSILLLLGQSVLERRRVRSTR